jgi:hypothetical protein
MGEVAQAQWFEPMITVLTRPFICGMGSMPGRNEDSERKSHKKYEKGKHLRVKLLPF